MFDFLHDEGASFTNSNIINVGNNFNNQGSFTNSGSATITVANDASFVGISFLVGLINLVYVLSFNEKICIDITKQLTYLTTSVDLVRPKKQA